MIKRLAVVLLLTLLVTLQVLPTLAQDNALVVDHEFTLRTLIGGSYSPMAFVGVSGEIDGIENPELVVMLGDVVRITVINGAPVLHDLTIDEYSVTTGQLLAAEQVGEVVFTATIAGAFNYFCSVPGHREAGMQGLITVVDPNATTSAPETAIADIVRNPADVPESVGVRDATTVQFMVETQEVVGQLADGTTYTYWTFGGQVPGPMLRVREGDTIELTVHNLASNVHVHSIDLHAVTGPGGGAVYTQTNPGAETTFTFQALNPGLYVYHCATPSVATHISNGMYGLILVEPEGGLPVVDREFYVMQGEIYTLNAYGTVGVQAFNYEALLDENPEYFVFNGAAGGLTSDAHALRANVGETVRIYFGVGGPNFISSFHVIGEIFDRVYDQASLTSNPLTDVQTTLIPPGGATMVEFTVEVPGRYILVDHALSRLERGLVGFLYVEGEENPEVFSSSEVANAGGH